MSEGLLIETCLEGGQLTEAQVRAALAGTAKFPQVIAMLSWIEYQIGKQRDMSEVRGQSHQTRDEACGAALALRELRQDFMDFASAARPADAPD